METASLFTVSSCLRLRAAAVLLVVWNQEKEKKGLNISAKSFISAIAVIFVLMVLTYILTFIVPGGEIPFWKWIMSPVLVLGAEGNGSLIAVLVFLLVIGGVFNSLEKGGLMRYLLDKITYRFGKNRYTLLAVITLFFMSRGAFIGSFEEAVPFHSQQREVRRILESTL